MNDLVITEVHDGIAEVLINRPGQYNAFDRPTILAFADAMTAVVKDPRVAI